MTRTETTARRSLRIQQATLEILRDRGPLTARDLAAALLRSNTPGLGWSVGQSVGGHLRTLVRDGLVERAAEPEVERGQRRTRWRLVEERCAGLLEGGQ